MVMSGTLKKIMLSKRKNSYSRDKSIEELRNEHFLNALSIPLPKGTVYKSVNVDGIKAEWISCGKITLSKVFLFIHGGGYYRGSVAATRSTASRISAASGMRCLSIDYRLAPENIFPAAIDDTYIAFKWLIRQGVLSENILVGGVSAGGGLALSLLLKLKETNESHPAGAVAISPWTDLTQSGKTMQTNAKNDPIISKDYLNRMSEIYLSGASALTPLASPLFGDLIGLPPILVQVGTAETMLDDSRRFVRKAEAANVEVKYEAWEDMFHGWHGSAHILDEAKQAIESIGLFCKKVIAV